MKVSIPVLDNRISPVFDESRRVLIVEVEDGVEIDRCEEPLHGMGPLWKVMHLTGLGVNVLICSAISCHLQRRLMAAGVQVIPHTCGSVEEVLNAFLSGRLTEHSFLMPGCRRRQGWRHGRSNSGRNRIRGA